MAMFYPEGEVREPFRGRPVPYHQQPAVVYWTTHYRNAIMLRFLIARTHGAERAGYMREMSVCERRMEHWRRHVNWDAQEGARAAHREDRLWVQPTRVCRESSEQRSERT